MNELQTEEKQPFEITDLGSLTWVFREILTPLNKEIETNKALAKAEIDRVNDWLASVNKSALSQVEDWEMRVQDYHFHTLLEDPKAKTLSTPYGKSKSRASKAAPEQADKDALLVHVLTNDMQDYIKKEVKWGDFKKNLSISDVDGVATVFDENGEKVPGVIVKPESISFSTEVT